jgi:hypothetical protein
MTERDFSKSQEHVGRPGVWLDVYKPLLRGHRMYVKIVTLEGGRGYLLLSFCRDGEDH